MDRWRDNTYGAVMRRDPDGDYVLFADAKAIEGENDRLREALRLLISATESLLMHGSPVPDNNGEPVPYQANPYDAESAIEEARKALEEV